jgi:hypothetical protein
MSFSSWSVEANYLQCLPSRSPPCPFECLGGFEKCTKLIESSSAEEVKEETELLRRLVPLFSKILAEEFDPDLGSHERILRKGESIHVVCDCCGGDIFQSFFRCLRCTPPTTANPRVGLALCAGCYCEGRTCLCGSEAKMQPCQMRDVNSCLRIGRRLLKYCVTLQVKGHRRTRKPGCRMEGAKPQHLN